MDIGDCRNMANDPVYLAIHRRAATEIDRRAAMTPEQRSWEDYGERWAEMQRGER